MRDEKVEAFRDEFEIINPDDLPPPEIDCRIPLVMIDFLDKELNERYLIKNNSENWVNEFR